MWGKKVESDPTLPCHFATTGVDPQRSVAPVVVERQVSDAKRSRSAVTHEQQLGQYRRSTCGRRFIR
jgi:hypothetical protein